MTIEFRPFLANPSTALLALSLQPSKDVSSSWDERFCMLTFCSMPNQKSRAKTQSSKRWFIVSVTVSLSLWRQREGWSRPRLASLSSVQHLLCVTSHMKKQHLLGAQVFQILSQENNLTDSWKNPYKLTLPCTVHLSWVTKYENRQHLAVVPKNSTMTFTQSAPCKSEIHVWFVRPSIYHLGKISVSQMFVTTEHSSVLLLWNKISNWTDTEKLLKVQNSLLI